MVTFTEIESILLNAVKLSDNSIKTIADATGIKASTLYKWKTTKVHLSPSKAETLLLYFMENEPFTLLQAAMLYTQTNILLSYLLSSSEEEVTEEE